MKTTGRALERATELGWTAGVVERRRPKSYVKDGARIMTPGRTEDLFGIIDVLAIEPEYIVPIKLPLYSFISSRIVGIQACGEDVQPHIRKILDCPTTEMWLHTGAALVLWAFRRRKFKLKSGRWSKAKRWHCKEYEFLITPNGVEVVEEGKKT